jgi:phosphoribosylanthranilate isomerase
VILSGGLDAANVREAVRAVRPWAVDVSSGVEERNPDGTAAKGIKDPARIAAFIEEVRHADV